MRAVLFLVAALALAGCGLIQPVTGEGVSADRLPYRTSLKRGEDPRNVAVSVRARGAGVDAVRESVRFPVTRYCLSNYGRSDALWNRDPASGDWAFVRQGETLVFQARCVAR